MEEIHWTDLDHDGRCSIMLDRSIGRRAKAALMIEAQQSLVRATCVGDDDELGERLQELAELASNWQSSLEEPTT